MLVHIIIIAWEFWSPVSNSCRERNMLDCKTTFTKRQEGFDVHAIYIPFTCKIFHKVIAIYSYDTRIYWIFRDKTIPQNVNMTLLIET